MARALIVACGCRGRRLGVALAEGGWQVRGTSRSDAGVAAIEAVGIDAACADPLRPGSILDLVGDATVIAYLLGSASGEDGDLDVIHGERLSALLARLVDTPVRGFVYETRGSGGAARLEHGRSVVSAAAERWRIPAAFVESDPRRGIGAWLDDARAAVDSCV